MEPSNWHIRSEVSSNWGQKSCCSKAIFTYAKNDQVKVGYLLIFNLFKIKNTEKVFLKSALELSSNGVIYFFRFKKPFQYF